MADEIDVLLARVEDDGLRQELAAHVGRLKQRRRFGLVFEEHLPESVVLPQHQIRRGIKVVPRDEQSAAPLVVTKVKGKVATLTDGLDKSERPVDELVAVAEFGEPIYPGLKRLGSIERGGDKPAHVVIKGENYHALEALQFTHAGRVDCIYIDPPYNTGARDWKYNNDYVDGEDAYRHSKWLSFMKKRLTLAKNLLDPEGSTLIVSIDEREYLRLGLLLEQVFNGARLQMISTVIKPSGQSRKASFARTDEYLFFVMLGSAAPLALPLGPEWKIVRDRRAEGLRWTELLRSGSATQREDRPNQFFPVFLRHTKDGPTFHSVGEPYFGKSLAEIVPPVDCVAVWPIRSNGSEGRWQVSNDALRALVANGYAKLGRWRGERTSISYLKRGEQAKVEAGSFPIVDRRTDNSIIVDESEYRPTFVPGTQWRIESHNPEQGGTNLQKMLIPGRKFPFPKSLYAVEDALRFFVADKPDAVVLDFFAGSGTTAHALARLNREDDGRRCSISVTNNEIAESEIKRLTGAGLAAGDPEWEALGIFDLITRPRIEAAITGQTHTGEPAKGNYRFIDEFPICEGLAENVEFVELEYLDPEEVQLDAAFEAVAPLLWMRAGMKGPVLAATDDAETFQKPYTLSSSYGVLREPDRWRSFVTELAPAATHAFIVTDSTSQFTSVAAELPPGVEAVRLYENYLSTFAINKGGTL